MATRWDFQNHGFPSQPAGISTLSGPFGSPVHNLSVLNQVHAHGGGILKVKDTFFWFGESYKRPLLSDFLSEGVNLYSSTDLATWHYEGLVFNGTKQMKGMPVEAPFRIERPKVLPSPSHAA